jgi:hypothetical protein
MLDARRRDSGGLQHARYEICFRGGVTIDVVWELARKSSFENSIRVRRLRMRAEIIAKGQVIPQRGTILAAYI